MRSYQLFCQKTTIFFKIIFFQSNKQVDQLGVFHDFCDGLAGDRGPVSVPEDPGGFDTWEGLGHRRTVPKKSPRLQIDSSLAIG